MRLRPTRLAACLAASVLLGGPPACAGAPPRRGADLRSTLDALLAPNPDRRPQVQLRRLRVFDLGAEPWREIPLAEIESGRFIAEPEGDYAVVAELHCSWDTPGRAHGGDAIAWYYFWDDALYAYEHVEFEEHCRRVPTIRGVAPGSDLREKMPALLERAP